MYSPNLYPKNVNPVNDLAKRKIKNIKVFIKNEKMYFCFIFNLRLYYIVIIFIFF